MDRETLTIKKCMLFFFSFAFLIMAAVGSFNALNVRFNGIKAFGRIVSFQKYHPYSRVNRFTLPRYRVKIQFSDASGKFQTLDAVLSGNEQQDFRAGIGTELPFWVVPATGQYSIGEKPPGLPLVIIANSLLIPAAVWLLVLAVRTRIPQ